MKFLLPERKREKPQIVLTNLIDVILMLVFFFMISSSFAKDKRQIPIETPKASTSIKIDGDCLTIQLAKDGKISIMGKTIQIEELPARLTEFVSTGPEKPILLEADETLQYGTIVEVLDVIQTNGGTNIGLSTRRTNRKKC